MRRVDPMHRTLGRVFRDEITVALHLGGQWIPTATKRRGPPITEENRGWWRRTA
jgi:hypothetical protein